MSHNMSDTTRRELKAKYDAWRAAGSVLSHRENSYKAYERVDADEWHTHDDEAKELYGELASYLFAIEDCGHQTVDVSGVNGEAYTGPDSPGTYTVVCADCPVSWTIKDGEVVNAS